MGYRCYNFDPSLGFAILIVFLCIGMAYNYLMRYIAGDLKWQREQHKRSGKRRIYAKGGF